MLRSADAIEGGRMALHLNHYSVRTDDLERTRRFYTEVLGLTVGPRPAFDFPGLWLYTGSHENYAHATVHVIGTGGDDRKGLEQYLGDRAAESSKGTGSVDHIAFSATGLREMLAHLDVLGIPYRQREVPTLGVRQVFLEDPNAVTIELNYPAHEPR
jgi:catechol 2,3-dioxygenase-like lactoylglutathione lyase family enzyme